jgi:hypothetical protein
MFARESASMKYRGYWVPAVLALPAVFRYPENPLRLAQLAFEQLPIPHR